MKKRFFVFALFYFVFLPFANADVISVNSGGNTELIISSDNYTEGFFIQPPICGNSFIESGEACDDGNTNNGDGCSSVCAVEITATTTTTSSASSGGGGGGGGGGSPDSISPSDIVAIPSELSVSVIKGVEEIREITFINIGSYSLVVSLDVVGDEIVDSLTSNTGIFSLAPGGQHTVTLSVLSENEGLFVGYLLLHYSIYTQEIPVVIASSSDNFLFDISVHIGDAFKKIVSGNKINAQFNLIEVNVKDKVDVTATYTIKDFLGKKYYESSETYFVLGEKNYFKDFPTESLKPGKYVLGFEVTYPGAFAVSSDTFEVVDNKIHFDLKTILIILAILGIIFMVWMIRMIILSKTKLPQDNNI